MKMLKKLKIVKILIAIVNVIILKLVLYIVGCRGVAQIGGLVLGFP